jgi:succinate dehydrogenase/fumarate reductase flavoprotein subunit
MAATEQQQQAASSAAAAESNVRRIEALLEDVKDLPVHKLKDEMKELQVRLSYTFWSPDRINASLSFV